MDGRATPEGRDALAKWRARQENGMRGAAASSPSPLRIAHLSSPGESPSPPASKSQHSVQSPGPTLGRDRGSRHYDSPAAAPSSSSSRRMRGGQEVGRVRNGLEGGGGGGGGQVGGAGGGIAGLTALEIWRSRRSTSPSHHHSSPPASISPSPASWTHGSNNFQKFSAGKAATATAVSSPAPHQLLDATGESRDPQSTPHNQQHGVGNNRGNNNNIINYRCGRDDDDAKDDFGRASFSSPPPSPSLLDPIISPLNRSTGGDANRQNTLRHRSKADVHLGRDGERREGDALSVPRGQDEWVSQILEPRIWATLVMITQALVSVLLWWEGYQSSEITILWLSQDSGGDHRVLAEALNMRGWLALHSLLILACAACLLSPIQATRNTPHTGVDEYRGQGEPLNLAATLISSWSNWLLFVSLTVPSDAYQSILLSLASSLFLPLLPPSTLSRISSSSLSLLHASLLSSTLCSYAWAFSNASTTACNIILLAMATIDGLFVVHRDASRPAQDASCRAMHLGCKASLLPFAAFNLRLVIG